MQQIERYGVIALVFLLVTIVAVSFWGDNKSPGFWSRLTGRGDAKKMEIAKNASTAERAVESPLPLNPNPSPAAPEAGQAPTPIIAAPVPAPAPVASAPAGPAPVANLVPGPHPAGNPAPANGSQLSPTAPQVAALPQPPAPSAPAPAVEPKDTHKAVKAAVSSGSTVEYVVQKGDSLASIAQKNLGSSSRWTEIQSLNGGIQPKALRVGTKLKLPATATAKSTIDKGAPKAESAAPKKALPASSEASHAGTIYVVRSGDTLRTIAEKKLGSGDRWKDIVAANPGLDPHKLAVGKSLHLPAGEAREGHDTGALVAAALPASSSASGKPRVR